MGVSLEGIEKEKAEKRQKATQFKPGNKIQRTRLLERPSSREEDRQQPQKHHRGSSYEIAKRIGVSHATYERSKKIIQKGSEDQKNLLRKGDLGIRKVYGQIRREEKKQDLVKKAAVERQQFKVQMPVQKGDDL